MTEQRYDISFRNGDPELEPHFCREWDGDRGCYGTNPHHGASFVDAVEMIAQWHDDRAKFWRSLTPEKAKELSIIY